MANIQSIASLEGIINGHRISGWSDDDPPFEFDFDDAVDIKRGADGAMYAYGMPNYGGQFTFKVFPASLTAQWAVQQEQMRKDAHRNGTPFRFLNMTLSDPANGYNFRCEGGVISNFPAVIIPNVTYEGVIEFEQITSNVDGARFNPPLTTP